MSELLGAVLAGECATRRTEDDGEWSLSCPPGVVLHNANQVIALIDGGGAEAELLGGVTFAERSHRDKALRCPTEYYVDKLFQVSAIWFKRGHWSHFFTVDRAVAKYRLPNHGAS